MAVEIHKKKGSFGLCVTVGSCCLLILTCSFKGMAKLANIVREHVKFDMFANNVAQIWPPCWPTNSGQKMFVACLYMLKTFSRTFVVRSNVV